MRQGVDILGHRRVKKDGIQGQRVFWLDSSICTMTIMWWQRGKVKGLGWGMVHSEFGFQRRKRLWW